MAPVLSHASRRYASRAMQLWDRVVACSRTGSATASCVRSTASSRVRRCCRSSRSTTPPTSRGCTTDRGQLEGRSAASSTTCSRTTTTCPNFQDISTDQYHAHRRRPLEDLLLLRLRLHERAELRALPRDHAPRRARSRGWTTAMFSILSPGQAHPAARRSVQGRAPLPPRAASSPSPRISVGIRVGGAGRALDRGQEPRVRRHVRARGVERHRRARASCCSSTWCASCASR